jgi:hypothetical protein
MTAELEELISFRADHVAFPLHTAELQRLSNTELEAYLKLRKQLILDAEANPLANGYIPHIWTVLDQQIAELRSKFPKGVIKLIIWGGHRSSKTRKASNYVLNDIVDHPGHRWWCCDSTEAMARTNQMRLLWEQMPEAWKNVPRDQVTDIRYSVSDGFPKNKFITPTASEVEFKFYSIDVKDLPGPEIDGIWGDELMPLDWVKFAMFRLVNRNGIFLLTFTPEFGWNDTIQYFYEGAQIVEESEAELLPKYDADGNQIGHRSVPRIMQCADPTARIIFFHTKDNPFGNYPGLVQELKGKSEEEILIRAYGVCTKSHTAAFPMFNKRAHVITQAQFAAILKQNPKTLRFQLLDPCDGRNWFMIWVACPRPDKWVIYREWPSHGNPKAYIEGIGHIGPWALSGSAADGVMGPAQKSFGFSLQAYVDEILRQENGETIFARYIDSRYATSPRVGAEHVTSLIEQIGEVGMDFLCMVPGKGRIIGMDRNDGSVDLINSALYYDVETDLGKFSPKLSRLNEPQLQVVDTCPNTIYALEHWTGQDGQKGACKDPIDCVRGLFLSSVNYVGDDMYAFTGGGR